jgi:hypothetical protein
MRLPLAHEWGSTLPQAGVERSATTELRSSPAPQPRKEAVKNPFLPIVPGGILCP